MVKNFYVYLDFESFYLEALLDTGAFSSAMSLINFEKIKLQCPPLMKSQHQSITKTVKMADGTSISIALRCSLIISIGGQTFQENFFSSATIKLDTTWNAFFQEPRNCISSK